MKKTTTVATTTAAQQPAAVPVVQGAPAAAPVAAVMALTGENRLNAAASVLDKQEEVLSAFPELIHKKVEELESFLLEFLEGKIDSVHYMYENLISLRNSEDEAEIAATEAATAAAERQQEDAALAAQLAEANERGDYSLIIKLANERQALAQKALEINKEDEKKRKAIDDGYAAIMREVETPVKEFEKLLKIFYFEDFYEALNALKEQKTPVKQEKTPVKQEGTPVKQEKGGQDFNTSVKQEKGGKKTLKLPELGRILTILIDERGWFKVKEEGFYDVKIHVDKTIREGLCSGKYRCKFNDEPIDGILYITEVSLVSMIEEPQQEEQGPQQRKQSQKGKKKPQKTSKTASAMMQELEEARKKREEGACQK